ncbi:hypothetical protein [Cryptosporidium hominis TU502]|uniref:hypothetical protein n=1 Tax=Cryptosporidium hominis (strain TU502) TaxID=353151 RepID=UPI0000452FC6|nr:hypothetical protein [Cryptosporidium hominis TU502]
MKDTEICEECMNLEEFHKVCCTLCGRVKCSNCNISNTVEYKIYDKLICEECISKYILRQIIYSGRVRCQGSNKFEFKKGFRGAISNHFKV